MIKRIYNTEQIQYASVGLEGFWRSGAKGKAMLP